MNQRPRIESRTPSRTQCYAKVLPRGGCIFRLPEAPSEDFGELIDPDTLAMFFPSPDSWVAMMVLRHVMGLRGGERHQTVTEG